MTNNLVKLQKIKLDLATVYDSLKTVKNSQKPLPPTSEQIIILTLNIIESDIDNLNNVIYEEKEKTVPKGATRDL